MNQCVQSQDQKHCAHLAMEMIDKDLKVRWTLLTHKSKDKNKKWCLEYVLNIFLYKEDNNVL